MKVLVAGDLAVVTLLDVAALPRPGDNLVAHSAAVYASGVAANIAWTLRDLVDGVAVLGAVGDDLFGHYLLDELSTRGVHTGYIQRAAAPTDLFTILVDGTGERTMIGHRGASACLALGDANMLLAEWAPDWCHVSGYTLLNPGTLDGFYALVMAASRRGIPCSIDLEGIAYTGQHLGLAGLTVFCNWNEYTCYFGRERVDPSLAADGLRLVIKAGADGCYLLEGGAVTPTPAYAATVVDCTGAGDAFNACFIAAMLAERGDREACAWGNAGAALKVARAGPRIELTHGAIQDGMARRAAPCRET